MNEFQSDDVWQRQQRDEYLVPWYYEKYYPGRYKLLDSGGLAWFLQRHGADTAVHPEDGDVVTISEKIVRYPGYDYTAFFLETDSCTNPGYESKGWMHTCLASHLLYCFQMENDDLDCHLIDMPAIKTWFWPHAEEFSTSTMATRNRTKGCVVPIELVQKNVNTWRYLIGKG